MGNPVRFYTMTPEEFDKLRKQMERDADGIEDLNQLEQARRDFENGIFFIEENKQEVKDDGSTK